MRKAYINIQEIFNEIPPELREETRMSFAISDKIALLMEQRGLSKKQLATAIGKRPNEVTRWLSGEHNFTIATLAKLSTFFGIPIITI
jgi:antitoxin component HigA of HigAB toxin-antitoxin module